MTIKCSGILHHTGPYDCLDSIIKTQDQSELFDALLAELNSYGLSLEANIRYAQTVGGFEPTIEQIQVKLANINRTTCMIRQFAWVAERST